MAMWGVGVGGHVVLMGRNSNAHCTKFWQWKWKESDHLEDRCWWQNIIKEDLKEIGWEGVDWINMAQGRDKWQAVVSTAMNLLVFFFYSLSDQNEQSECGCDINRRAPNPPWYSTKTANTILTKLRGKTANTWWCVRVCVCVWFSCRACWWHLTHSWEKVTKVCLARQTSVCRVDTLRSE